MSKMTVLIIQANDVTAETMQKITTLSSDKAHRPYYQTIKERGFKALLPAAPAATERGAL